jgi:hypothetical protein
MIGRVILLLILLLAKSLYSSQEVKTVLSQLSPSERLDLTELFKIFINEDQFGYTLFGDKPVSLSGKWKIIPYEFWLSGSIDAGPFWRKWAVWKEIQHQFSINHFLFIEEPALHLNLDGNVTFIFLINKQAFLKTVNKYLKSFQEILGSDLTAQILLTKIEVENKLLSSINHNEMLLGILLGYGLHNSRLFERRRKINKLISGEDMSVFPELLLLLSPNLSLFEEEENLLSYQLQPFSDLGPWNIEPVRFAADLSHRETQLLKKKYARSSKELLLHFSQKKDFLEIVLTKLTSN